MDTSDGAVPETGTDQVTEPRRSRRKALALIAAGVVVAGGLVATPFVAQAVDRNAAEQSFADASARLTKASMAYASASEALQDRIEVAKEELVALEPVIAVLPAALVDPASVLGSYSAQVQSFADTAGIVVDAASAEAVAVEGLKWTTFVVPEPPAAPSGTEELREQAAQMEGDAHRTQARADGLVKLVGVIDDRHEDAVAALMELLPAAHSKGTSLAPLYTKAGAAEAAALQAAIAALLEEGASDVAEATSKLTAYVNAVAAANTSHAAVVAAEEAAPASSRSRTRVAGLMAAGLMAAGLMAAGPTPAMAAVGTATGPTLVTEARPPAMAVAAPVPVTAPEAASSTAGAPVRVPAALHTRTGRATSSSLVMQAACG